MAKKEITLQGFNGKVDEMVLTTNGNVCNLEKCVRMLFPQNGETTPKLRFKGFEGEWERKLLSDCLEISEEKNTENIFGIDDVLSVSDDYGVVNQIELLGRSYAGKSVSGYKILRPNQIVYTKSPLKAKPFGIVKQNTGKAGIVSVLYAVYNTKEGVAPEYIHYYFDPAWRLNAYMRPLVNKGAKNTMNISDETALTGFIMIPKNIEEQKRIASYLRNLDDQIAIQQKQLERLKQMKQACLNSLFPDNQQFTPPRLRFKGFEGQWITRQLSTVASFSKGKGYSKNDLQDTGTPIILYGRMYTSYNTIIDNVDTFVTQKPNSVLSRGNEIIIPASGETPEDIACASVVEKCGVILGGDLNIIRLTNSSCDPHFTALAITYGNVHKELAKYAQGKTVVHLHNSEIRKVSIAYPPTLEEQKRIASFFRTLDEKISIQSRQVEKLIQMKKACLNKIIA